MAPRIAHTPFLEAYHCSVMMLHEFRIRDGQVQCGCGYVPAGKTPAELKSQIETHVAKKRPGRAEIAKIIEALREHERGVDRLTTSHPGDPVGLMTPYPDPPANIVADVRDVIHAFEWMTFPTLKKFVRDPSEPDIKDVVEELGHLRGLL